MKFSKSNCVQHYAELKTQTRCNSEQAGAQLTGNGGWAHLRQPANAMTEKFPSTLMTEKFCLEWEII